MTRNRLSPSNLSKVIERRTPVGSCLCKSALTAFTIGLLLVEGIGICAQTPVVTNLTSTPVPGAGHSYLSDMNEIVNPANGSLSVRIEVPRPKERGLNYPIFAYLYDSNNQFSVQYPVQFDTSGGCEGNSGTGPGACVVYVHGPSLLTPNQQTMNSGPNTLTWAVQSYTYYLAYAPKTCTVQTGYVYEDPAGVSHPLGITVPTSGTDTICQQFFGITPQTASGDEAYKVQITDGAAGTTGNSIVDEHGDTILLSGGTPVGGSSTSLFPIVEDSNGNYANGTGRTGSYNSFPTSYYAHTQTPGNTMNFPGLAAGYTYTWGQVTTNIQLNATDITQTTDNLCGPNSGNNVTYGGTTQAQAVSKITLPDQLAYKFDYDPNYALISKITYPTGATVTYTWGMNSNSEVTGWGVPGGVSGSHMEQVYVPSGGSMNSSCVFRHDFPTITKRVVSYDGVTPALEEDFSYSTVWPSPTATNWTSKSTTVTTYDLLRSGHPSFQTVYNYSPAFFPAAYQSQVSSSAVPVESSIVYKDTAGNALRTVVKSWNTYNQLIAKCTILPNQAVSGAFYQYAPYSWGTGGPPTTLPQARLTTQLTDVAEYDFGLVSASCARPTTTPTRETSTTFAPFANSSLWPSFSLFSSGSQTYQPQSMVDRPQTIKKYDHGVLLSETDYVYDYNGQSHPIAVNPTPIGHDETNYGSASTLPRGNPTSITGKCFQSSGSCSDAVAGIGYDTTGQPISVVDPDQNTISLSYADHYTTDDGSSQGNTNTYLTKITKPKTGTVSHIESLQWDFNRGELRVGTDENNLNTSFYTTIHGTDCGRRIFPTGAARNMITVTPARTRQSLPQLPSTV